MEEAVLHIILFTQEHNLQKLSIHQALEHIATKKSLWYIRELQNIHFHPGLSLVALAKLQVR